MQEDVFLLIESNRKEMTYVEQLIADYFLAKNPPMMIDKLAKRLSVSKASITRFCKKISLNNYKELIFLYKLSLDNAKKERSVSSVVTAAYHSLATRSEQMYVEKKIDQFCEYIHQHKIIHFYGKGFNSFVALDFQFKFSRLGKYVRISSDENSITMASKFAETDELIIVSSLRGQDKKMCHAMQEAKAKSLSILLLTSNQQSELIPFADVYLFTAFLTREEALGNISPQIPILIQLDMVYERYIHLYADSVKKWIESERILHQ
ncbi:MurR/RpiR family transcriptional regulator [Enterococcus villorum]|uniref:Transcriptional regulator n=2 Tax=Enterococcus villorum TaxID=112904 RepID=A0A511J4V5_9ENTE|nr:MurR/RpiR family transcriptional regulator [Enterococcus villorum]EOH87364.1 hypothetical protein UAO_02075 [Enterococcus villorum ATCC 700913]EOW77917.1 hypothetical protein I591_00771 [Enterococcus villorum ATCC 700913]GEL93032.1 transcriptional regulator [Enterococcus villorum]